MSKMRTEKLIPGTWSDSRDGGYCFVVSEEVGGVVGQGVSRVSRAGREGERAVAGNVLLHYVV